MKKNNAYGLNRTLASNRTKQRASVVVASDNIRSTRSGTSSFGIQGTRSASDLDWNLEIKLAKL